MKTGERPKKMQPPTHWKSLKRRTKANDILRRPFQERPSGTNERLAKTNANEWELLENRPKTKKGRAGPREQNQRTQTYEFFGNPIQARQDLREQAQSEREPTMTKKKPNTDEPKPSKIYRKTWKTNVAQRKPSRPRPSKTCKSSWKLSGNHRMRIEDRPRYLKAVEGD